MAGPTTAAATTTSCAACHGPDPRFRCTSCRSAWYCSRTCQRRDWNDAQHRRYCRAATELATILRSVSPEQAEQEYYKAKDQIDSILIENERNRTSKSSPPKATTKSSGAVQSTTPPEDALGEEGQVDVVQSTTSLPSPCNERPHNVPPSSYATIPFRIQHMPHLYSYQVQVRGGSEEEASDSAINVDGLECCLESSADSDFTRWILRETNQSTVLLSLYLPGRIVDVTVFDEAPTYSFFFKLSYEPPSADVQRTKSKLSVSALATIRCRSCRAVLLNQLPGSSDDDVASVRQILPLHSGQFHELMDYLICYPGQPAVDVGTNSLSRTESHVALEDDTSIVLHGQEHNSRWTVLAVPGYGEDPWESTPTHPSLDVLETSAARRGVRPWRDWVGGATLTCTSCASILGFAPMQEETLTTASRLLKHRIEWSESGTSDPRPYRVVDFIMNEMIRYAETKAIFAFQVSCEGGTDGCLMLRLTKWDSDAVELLHGPGVTTKSLDLEWRQLVQVVYQESTIPSVEADTDSSSLWMWTKDWCCPPANKKELTTGSSPDAPSSLVRLFLSLCEYESLRQDLQSAHWYSDAASHAIVLSTIGQSASDAKVAAILL